MSLTGESIFRDCHELNVCLIGKKYIHSEFNLIQDSTILYQMKTQYKQVSPLTTAPKWSVIYLGRLAKYFIGNFSHFPDGQIIFQMCEAES